MNPISKAFVAAIHAFTNECGVPLLTFEKGQRKDAVMGAAAATQDRSAVASRLLGRAASGGGNETAA